MVEVKFASLALQGGGVRMALSPGVFWTGC
jgi:hypothetical protein